MLLQNPLKRLSSSLYHKHIPIRNKKRPAAARRFCISLFIQIKAAGIIVAKLNVLVPSVALKIVLEHQVPAVLPQSGHGQIIGSIFFLAFILLSLAVPGDQQSDTGEQTPGQANHLGIILQHKTYIFRNTGKFI